jgi:hypothetical protein
MCAVVPWRWFGAETEPDWLAETRDALADLGDVIAWVDDAQTTARGPRIWLLEQPLRVVRRRLEALGFAVEGEPGRGARPRPVTRACAFGSALTPRHRLDAYDAARGIGVDVEWSPEPPRRPALQEVSLLDADVRYLVLVRRWARRRGGFPTAEHVVGQALGHRAARKLPLRGVLLLGV